MTYGIELEYGDWDKRRDIPDGAKWDIRDNTCVSSTGIANDPLSKLYHFGGEANTRPTYSINEQINHIERIINELNPSVNYRCNLHVHIGVPGLKNDLTKCKKLLKYFQENAAAIFKLVDPLPIPKSTNKEILKWEKLRFNRMKVSHHYLLPKQRFDAVMASETSQQFLDEHAPLTEKGRMWHFAPRPAMNMRQLWETGTIEFRHFPGTLNLEEIRSALFWCQSIVQFMPDPEKYIHTYTWSFPKFQPYNFEMEQCYQWTNFAHNSRSTIETRLNQLRELIDIDNLTTTAKQTYEAIIHLRGEHKPIDSSANNLQTMFPDLGL